jgi:serine/threonine protein kinase
MPRTVKCHSAAGEPIEFVDEIIGTGAMKEVYFSPDKSYVVAFYKTMPDAQACERLQMITGQYRSNIFDQVGAQYWRSVFCWPTALVKYGGRLGLVVPTYAAHFFFAYGAKDQDFLGIKGHEKEGKWFASANNQNRFLDPRECGDRLNFLKICIHIARSVRRLHAAGLAHSDLSYKNVLIDPVQGFASVIDLDGLVVPGKYPPDVVGTPDFIAPEVVMTSHLAKNNPQRVLPSIHTDRHALAVLLYMYLFYRHPLRGGCVHDVHDTQVDETLAMGARALFIEHPQDASNRVNLAQARPTELPWADTGKIPYTLAGPYLSPLFLRAFTDGLTQPQLRPTADDWESALVKTVDLVQPCQNSICRQKWYVFDNTTEPACPFCGRPHMGTIPVLNLYSTRQAGSYRPDNHRLMVWTGQSLFAWHTNRLIAPNERLAPTQLARVGYFVLHQSAWWLVNEGLPDLMDVQTRTGVAVGDKVQLRDGLQLLLSKEEGGRLAVVQMVQGS